MTSTSNSVFTRISGWRYFSSVESLLVFSYSACMITTQNFMPLTRDIVSLLKQPDCSLIFALSQYLHMLKNSAIGHHCSYTGIGSKIFICSFTYRIIRCYSSLQHFQACGKFWIIGLHSQALCIICRFLLNFVSDTFMLLVISSTALIGITPTAHISKLLVKSLQLVIVTMISRRCFRITDEIQSTIFWSYCVFTDCMKIQC